MTAAAFPRRPAWAIDRLGVVIALIGFAALYAAPFVVFRPNRIASGRGVALWAALPTWAWTSSAALLSAAFVVALWRGPAPVRFAVAGLAIVLVLLMVGETPATLAQPGNTFFRVSPAAGFWLLLFAAVLMLADAVTRLALGPLARVGLLAVAGVAVFTLLGSGAWDGLSVMREYANRSDVFWQEGRTHLTLAGGSLAVALVIGLPLGVACQRSRRLAASVLPVLGIVQTIPSMALYGIMMVPLGLLSAASPLAASLGIHGIGAAPAGVALVLYALLPVVANTVLGLADVPGSVVEAARGMGLSSRQSLFRVELPLALPVILTGVRVVLVQNIGMVTIAALIGGGGFGAFVFQGLGQAATDLVLLGALPTIALAFTAAILMDAVVDLVRVRAR